MRTLLTGGVKSGKSSRALTLGRDEFPKPYYFIATSEIMDGEMAERVRIHRAERGTEFITIEEPLRIDRAMQEAIEAGAGGIILDCLPLWVNNLLYRDRIDEFRGILDAFISAPMDHVVVVTNETGLGNIPFDPDTRRYNLLLAEVNRTLAAAYDRVEFLVSGIPVKVK